MFILAGDSGAVEMQGGPCHHLPVSTRVEQHIYAPDMSDRLQELGIFVRAAEAGSFSRAARELGTTQPSVSRTIAGLERRLGVKLLLRTTRRITLTEAGSVLLERARHILPEIDEAEEAARGTDSLRGLLKVAMPVAFGIREVIPRLPAFLADHPQLRIDFAMADGAEDLVAEGVDVALRLGQLADSGFGSRKLASVPRYLVASPGYLDNGEHRPRLPTWTGMTASSARARPAGRAGSSWTARSNGRSGSRTVQRRIGRRGHRSGQGGSRYRGGVVVDVSSGTRGWRAGADPAGVPFGARRGPRGVPGGPAAVPQGARVHGLPRGKA